MHCGEGAKEEEPTESLKQAKGAGEAVRGIPYPYRRFCLGIYFAPLDLLLLLLRCVLLLLLLLPARL